ncbi:hypothetical protein MB02_04780 [Croceicoccus estronivorus]|nr:hypothetical protein MB02_04780 [Croceicoccus estronivorus]
MERERTLQAIARIERALDHLEASNPTAPDALLQQKHDALRKNVNASLTELDLLIQALEK